MLNIVYYWWELNLLSQRHPSFIQIKIVGVLYHDEKSFAYKYVWTWDTYLVGQYNPSPKIMT